MPLTPRQIQAAHDCHRVNHRPPPMSFAAFAVVVLAAPFLVMLAFWLAGR